MTILAHLSITEALDKLNKKEISSVELTKAYCERIKMTESARAYIYVNEEESLSAAGVSDQRRKRGDVGKMEGIPIGIKDLFATKNEPTTACSHILKGFRPAYESTVTANLKKSGIISLGKTNMDEFAMGSANITSAYGSVINPWKRKGSQENLVPGGSSGGSAAAVANYSAMGAIGSDTGGSIRQPAAFCGLVGIKPTYGLCSRYGMVAFASSLDQAGPLTRTVADNALMLECMAGFDSKDSTSMNVSIPAYSQNLKANLKGKRIGIPKEYRLGDLNPEILESWDEGISWLRAEGAEIIEISLPHTEYALPVYYVIAPAEASSNLARYDGVRYGLRVPGQDLNDLYQKTRAEGFGAEVKRRILMGTYVLSSGYYDAYFRKAQKVRRLIQNDFDQAFTKVDLILSPATPNTAFSADNPPTDPITMYMNDVLTVPANLAGLPAISVPTHLSQDGLPLGLQIIGRAFAEQEIFQAAYALEQAAQFEMYRSVIKNQ